MRSFRNSSPSICCSRQNKFSCRLITAELSGLPRYTFLHTHSHLWKLSGWCTAFLSAPVVTEKYDFPKKRAPRGAAARGARNVAFKDVTLALFLAARECYVAPRRAPFSSTPVWAAGGGDLEFQRSNKDNKGLKFPFNYVEFCAPPHRSSLQLSCVFGSSFRNWTLSQIRFKALTKWDLATPDAWCNNQSWIPIGLSW